MIISICSDPKILEIMRLINIFISIIRIIVPILLIFSISLKLMSVIKTGNEDQLAKVKKSSIYNITAAVLIFLIPTIVSIVVNISFPNSDYKNCLTTDYNVIVKAYNDKEEELITRVEETLDQNAYNNANNYLKNVKDENKRKSYEERLEVVKNKISDSHNQQIANSKDYDKVNYNNFKWHAYKSETGPVVEYYKNVMNYAIWAPDDVNDLNNVSLPLIVWLHGAAELSYQPGMSIWHYVEVAFPKVISNWSKYNLKPIPAIIVAPQAISTWDETNNIEKHMQSIKALIEYAQKTYNIDLNNVVLMGHSIGGLGVVRLSYRMNEKYSHDYFSKLVVISGINSLKYPPDNLESGRRYYSQKDIRGYNEDERSKPFYTWINKPENFFLYKGVEHGDMPEKAITEDKDGNGISDMIEWLFNL